MLVDALDDGIPLWPKGSAPLHLPFTPADAVWCTACLLDRVAEGGAETAALLRAGEVEGAARRVRDDVVRLCTALLLMHGETRPRRGDAVRRIPSRDPVLRWAAGAFGPPGHEEDAPVPPPPGGFGAAFAAVERLRGEVIRGRRRLVERARSLRNHPVYHSPDPPFRAASWEGATAPRSPRVQP